MKSKIIILLLLSISTLSYSQNNSESDIFKKIIDHEIVNGELYILCNKRKTFFDLKEFKEQTELKVPLKILKEIEKNAEKSNDGMWNPELLQDLYHDTHYLKSKECLTKKEVEQLFEKTGKRQSVLSISEPIFDERNENCVVSVAYWNFKGSAFGHSYFLTKVYGSWTILRTYDTWMT